MTTLTSVTLADFLLARIAEDEEEARAAALTVGWRGFGDERIASGSQWIASYNARWDPARSRNAEDRPARPKPSGAIRANALRGVATC